MRLPRLRFTVQRMMGVVATLALVCGGITCSFRLIENRLVVENRSGQPITRLQVKMRSSPIATFTNVPDGSAETASFRINGDDSFEVSGVLADGSTLSGNYGYVTNGDFGERPRFVVRRGGKIEFSP